MEIFALFCCLIVVYLCQTKETHHNIGRTFKPNQHVLSPYNPKKQMSASMDEIMTCKKCCLFCSNSFSEPESDESGEDILHCMAKDGEIVNPMDYCDEYN